MTSLLILALLSQGVVDLDGRRYRWDLAKQAEAPTRDTWVLTEREQAAGCFVAATWFADHLVQVNCPAPFNPYGVTWHRYCVVKTGERLERAKVLILRDGRRQLWVCEVKEVT